LDHSSKGGNAMAAGRVSLSWTRIMVWSGLLCVLGGAAIVAGNLVATDFDDPEQAQKFLAQTEILEELEPESKCGAESCPTTGSPASSDSSAATLLVSKADKPSACASVNSTDHAKSCGKEHSCPLSKIDSVVIADTQSTDASEKSAHDIIKELTQGGPVSEELKPLVEDLHVPELAIDSAKVSELPTKAQAQSGNETTVCHGSSCSLEALARMVNADDREKLSCCNLNSLSLTKVFYPMIRESLRIFDKQSTTDAVAVPNQESKEVCSAESEAAVNKLAADLHRHWTSIIEKGLPAADQSAAMNGSSLEVEHESTPTKSSLHLIGKWNEDESRDYCQFLSEDSVARKEFLQKLNECIESGKYEGILLTSRGMRLFEDIDDNSFLDILNHPERYQPQFIISGFPLRFNGQLTKQDNPLLGIEWIQPGDYYSKPENRPVVKSLSQVIEAAEVVPREEFPSRRQPPLPAPIEAVAESIPAECPKALHLRRAAAELDQAGLVDKAAELRKQADEVQAAFEAEEMRNHPVQVTGGQIQELQKTLAELREEVKQLKQTIETLKQDMAIGARKSSALIKSHKTVDATDWIKEVEDFDANPTLKPTAELPEFEKAEFTKDSPERQVVPKK